MQEEPLYFPLFVDLRGKRVVIAGAGRIANKRIRAMLDFGAAVTVVAPRVSEDVQALADAGRLTLLRRAFSPDDVSGAYLVFAATGSGEANEEIAACCRKNGIPVNDGSCPARCDFFFPAVVRRDPLVVGLTTCGRDHAGTKAARQAIERLLDEAEHEPNT